MVFKQLKGLTIDYKTSDLTEVYECQDCGWRYLKSNLPIKCKNENCPNPNWRRDLALFYLKQAEELIDDK